MKFSFHNLILFSFLGRTERTCLLACFDTAENEPSNVCHIPHRLSKLSTIGPRSALRESRREKERVRKWQDSQREIEKEFKKRESAVLREEEKREQRVMFVLTPS